MEERMEHFRAVEKALYEETGFQEKCSRAQVAAALMSIDPELTDKQVGKSQTAMLHAKGTVSSQLLRGIMNCSHYEAMVILV